MASYRYRALIPARELAAAINDFSADVLIFAKPQPAEMEFARRAKERGQKVIADFCDDHFDTPHYQAMHKLADTVTCPTAWMARKIGGHVVPDPYEFEEAEPHCAGDRLLWFGNATNLYSLARIAEEIEGLPLRVVSNALGCIPWSMDTMRREFAAADIVVLPATKEYKSPNRAVESIRQGCFVVAEPHPSLEGLPIYIGDIPKGIEWAKQNLAQANEMIRVAQEYVRSSLSPRTQASAWRKVLASV